MTLLLTTTFAMALFGGAPPAGALYIDTFAGGDTNVTIYMDNVHGGVNDTVEILIPTNSKVLTAKMNVSTFHDSGPENPDAIFIDIGSDGVNDWEWNGTGYGSFGNQTLFSNGLDERTFQYSEATTNLSTKITLPTEADIMEADFKVHGDPEEFFEEFQYSAHPYDWSGYFVGDAGDVNGDGHPDFFSCAPHWWASRDFGGVYIYFGNRTLEDEPDVVLRSLDDTEFFGIWASSAGDVNHDGYDDIIVGAKYADVGAMNSAGKAYIYFGGDPMDTSVDVVLNGNSSSDYFGISVAGVGDVNNDGFDDVLVGASNNNSIGSWSGSAYMYFGGDPMDNFADLVFTPRESGDELGVMVASAGDFNNDTYPDFMIGADYADHGSDYGRVEIHFGGPGLDNVSDLDIIPAGADHFGTMGADLGDLNGDGITDIGIQDDWNEIWVFFGGDVVDANRDLLFVGESIDDYYGTGVDGVGDINKDGYDDLVIGACGWDFGSAPSVGKAYVYYGGEEMDTTADFVFYGSAEWDEFGIGVAGVHDFNDDGFLDFVIGSDGIEAGGMNSGSAFLEMYYVGTRDPRIGLEDTGEDLWNFTGPFTGDLASGDIADQLDAGLAATGPTEHISFGYALTDLTVNFTADSRSSVDMTDLHIRYETALTLNDFTTVIGQFIATHNPAPDGYYHIPIKILTTSKGGFVLEGLDIVLDGPPTFDQPPVFVHYEGSINNTLVDLHAIFEDDFNDDDNLTFEVKSYTNDTYVTVKVYNGRFLSVDAFTDSFDVNWTGSTLVKLTCADKSNLTSDILFLDIDIVDVPDPPVIVSSPVLEAMEAHLYEYIVKAEDGDIEDVLEYSILEGPSNMSINATSGRISWKPVLDQLGTHDITVMVDDGELNSTQDFSVSVSIRNTEDNRLPIINTEPIIRATVGVEYYYDIDAYDDDWDPLTYTLVTGPEEMTLDKITGELVWLPRMSDVGDHEVVVNVSDGQDRVFQRFTINVTDTGFNHFPDIIGSPPTNAYVDIEFYYRFNYSDEDGDNVTFSKVSGPDGLRISGDGIVTWRPNKDQVGSQSFSVKLHDGKGYVIKSFTVGVTINHPPVFTSDPVVDGQVKVQYQYTVVASDTDAEDLVQLELVRFPTGMTFDAGTKVLEWKPVKGQEGEQQVSIKAFDGKNATYQNFTIYVKKEAAPQDDGGLEAMLPYLLLAIVAIVILVATAIYMMKKRAGEQIIEDVFLIYGDGRLMSHHTRRLKPETDEHTITAMLTAIQDFVRESIPTEGEEKKAIEEISFGDARILLSHGKYIYIAAVLSGSEGKEFLDKMQESVDKIEKRFKDLLKEWDGDLRELDGAKLVMKELLHGEVEDEDEEKEEEEEKEGNEEE
jgi:hypothetical protein